MSPGLAAPQPPEDSAPSPHTSRSPPAPRPCRCLPFRSACRASRPPRPASWLTWQPKRRGPSEPPAPPTFLHRQDLPPTPAGRRGKPSGTRLSLPSRAPRSALQRTFPVLRPPGQPVAPQPQETEMRHSGTSPALPGRPYKRCPRPRLALRSLQSIYHHGRVGLKHEHVAP